MAGVRVPAVAVEHQYVLTGPIDDVHAGRAAGACRRCATPIILVYYKPDGPGSAGRRLRARHRRRSATTAIPSPFQRRLLDPDFDRFAPARRARRQAHAGASSRPASARWSTAPIPYSADADFVMGTAPELDNFFVATGFLYGIAAGGGAGKMMAEWILEGRPSLDLWPLDVRRFSFHHTTRHFMGPRMVELYGHHYKLAAPGSEHVTARGVRRSPLHDALAAAGRRVRLARRMGAAELVRARRRRARRRARRSAGRTGSSTSAREHSAVRERRGADRPDVVRQVRDHRARARSPPCSGCRSPTWTSRSARSPTRSCATSGAASSAT